MAINLYQAFIVDRNSRVYIQEAVSSGRGANNFAFTIVTIFHECISIFKISMARLDRLIVCFSAHEYRPVYLCVNRKTRHCAGSDRNRSLNL